MIVLYLGDTSQYLSDLAHAHCKNAQLVTENNLKNLSSGTYYTSLSDVKNLFNLGVLLQQLQRTDKIIYAPPPHGQWSNKSLKDWTEDYLKIFSFRTNIENFETLTHQSTQQKINRRKTQDSPQLWIYGCSISYGVGVNLHCRYGELVASRFNLPVSFLTQAGSSIQWAADQILRSDITENDIVVWGLTSHLRTAYYHDDELIHVNHNLYLRNPHFAKILDPDHLSDANNFYHILSNVYQVINFCRQIKAHLIIASLLDNDVVYYIKDFPNLVMLSNLWGRDKQEMFADLGTDKEHPGPITHQFYADEICRKISQLIAKK